MIDLRDQIELVFQETFVFDTTMRENIAVGRPNATDAEIAKAAKGRTTIRVTNRIAQAATVDLIFVLESGRLVDIVSRLQVDLQRIGKLLDQFSTGIGL